MNKHNLAILANYLATLPADYERFNMADFVCTDQPDWIGPHDAKALLSTNHCGTAACAVGHASMLFETYIDEGWFEFTHRVFGVGVSASDTDISQMAFMCMFGSDWYFVDDTAIGAAKRIALIVQNLDIVNDAFSQVWSEWQSGPIVYKNMTVDMLDDLFEDTRILKLMSAITFPIEVPNEPDTTIV